MLVAFQEPGDVIAKRPGGGRGGLVAATEGLVGVEGLVEQDRQAPAVDRDVVDAPDELMQVPVNPDQCQAQQRRSRRVETRPAIRVDEGREPFLSIGVRQPTPVMVFDKGHRPPVDDLVRQAGIAPVDRAPQRWVPRDQTMPRLAKGREVELAPQPAGELLDVMARLRVDQRVKEHALLDRREGIRVVDPALGYEPVPQLFAVEPVGHQRERLGGDGRFVGGVVALRHGRCEAGDRRGLEQLGGVHDQARLPGPRDEANADDRVDSDLEEVVVNADAVPSQ